jgi:hypothetical protein
VIPGIRFARDSLTVAENAGFILVEVELSVPAPAPVQVSYATIAGSAEANRDFRPANGTLNFAVGQQRQSFRVDVISDGISETAETLQLRLSQPVGGVLVGPTALTLTIIDSDEPPEVRFAIGAASVAESAGAVGISIELSVVSALDVRVPYTVGGTAGTGDHSLRAGTLIIPAGSSGARLNVAIVDDQIDEDDETMIVTLGTPTHATLGALRTFTLTIRDNDTAGIAVSPVGLTLTEGGPAQIYTIRLTSQPLADVTVSIDGMQDGQVTLNAETFTFTPANWNLARIVLVNAVDDNIDEGEATLTTLTHVAGSADPRYIALLGPNVAVTVNDNDTADLLVSVATLSLAEGGPAQTYTVRLNSEPTAPVTVTLNGGGRVTLTPATLTFTAANWNVAQIVTARAVDDTEDQGATYPATISHTIASADGFYAALPVRTIAVTITDNDAARIVLSPTALSITEGDTGTYTVALDRAPFSPVTISLAASDPTFTLTPAGPLVFNGANWNTPVTIRVEVDNNDVADGDRPATIRHTGSAAAGSTPPSAPNLAVTVVDDDSVGVNIAPLTLDLDEGGADDAYTVVLNSEPLAAVTITLIPAAQVEASPQSLTFTPADWDVAQTITVSVPDDDIDSGDRSVPIVHTAASGDPLYNGLGIDAVTVNISEDDVAGIAFDPETLTVREGGAAATYAVALTSEPLAAVTITLVPDAQVAVSPLSLTFTPANWEEPQTVALTAVDDGVDEDAPHPGTVVHTAAGAGSGYAGISATLTVDVFDPVRITIAEEVEQDERDVGTSTMVFTVTLDRASPAEIRVPYTISDGTAERGSDYTAPAAGILTFAPDEREQAIIVTINGDTLYEPDETFFVQLGAPEASDDADGVQVTAGLGVGRILNDDAPDLSFDPLEYVVIEPAAPDDTTEVPVTVRLAAPMDDPVTVGYNTESQAGTATAGSDYQAASGTLSFAPGVTEQTFTVTILGDDVDEPDPETIRIVLENPAGATVRPGSTIATIVIVDQTESPLARTSFLQTGGPNLNDDGWNYYANVEGSYSYARIDVPCIVDAPGVVVELISPEIGDDPYDVVRGAVDMTTFELYRLPPGWSVGDPLPAPGAPTSVTAQSYPPGDLTQPFATLAAGDCGSFLLRSEVSDNDTNGWGFVVGWNDPGGVTSDLDGVPGSGDEIGSGLQQATVLLASVEAGNPCVTLYQYVAPGQAAVTFHNYDLDGMARVRYYPPGIPYDPQALSDGIAGTVSNDNVWNGSATPQMRGGDTIVNPAPGWWRIVTCNTNPTVENYIIQEGQTGVPVYLAPPPAPALELRVANPTAVGDDVFEVALTVRNRATGAAAGAAYNTAVRFTLPAGLSLLEGCGNACVTGVGGAVQIDLNMLAAGAEQTVTVRIQAAANLRVPLLIAVTTEDVGRNHYRSQSAVVIGP